MAETNFQRENCLVVLAEFIRDRRVNSARAIRQREEKKETKERERERERVERRRMKAEKEEKGGQ